MKTDTTGRPITLLVGALGGEGGGVLVEWLVSTAAACGFAAQSTSIPGVAQRTGSTTYYLEVYPLPLAELNGKRPVFSLYPVPGALDVLVSSELLETVRQIDAGMVSPERTQVLTSTSRTLTTAEKMQLGDGRSDSRQLLELVEKFSRSCHAFDMAVVARDAGTVVSAVLMGAIAGSGVLPFAREAFENTIRGSGRGVEASLKGFARAFDLVRGGQPFEIKRSEVPEFPAVAVPPSINTTFPHEVHDVVALGHARVSDYQDRRYAHLYLERLMRVLEAEKTAAPGGRQDFAVTRETARYLALWMAFDDLVRVADLKSRASRMMRIRGETAAAPDELLRVYDFFKPGVPELAGLLPDRIARVFVRWDARWRALGKQPWSLPLKVGAHSVFGYATLRVLANLKWLRKRSQRYAQEQALIERWLDAIVSGLQSGWQVGLEVAQCGRMIKGYGSTNERGKENLLHVMDHLMHMAFESATLRANAIRDARTAALADDSGKSLDRALASLGAPARPVKAQPVMWVKKAQRSAHSNKGSGASTRAAGNSE